MTAALVTATTAPTHMARDAVEVAAAVWGPVLLVVPTPAPRAEGVRAPGGDEVGVGDRNEASGAVAGLDRDAHGGDGVGERQDKGPGGGCIVGSGM